MHTYGKGKGLAERNLGMIMHERLQGAQPIFLNQNYKKNVAADPSFQKKAKNDSNLDLQIRAWLLVIVKPFVNRKRCAGATTNFIKL